MARKVKSVLHHVFLTEFDPKLPPHWTLRLRTPGPGPWPVLRIFDNPLTIREELRVEVGEFKDKSLFDFTGRIQPGKKFNITDKIAEVELVEEDIPTEILEDSTKLLRLKFDGKKLKGTFVVNKRLGSAFFEPGTTEGILATLGESPHWLVLDEGDGGRVFRSRAAVLSWFKAVGRLRESGKLDGIEFTDRYDALGMAPPNPETMCKGGCEGVGCFPVYMVAGDKRKAGLRLDDESDPTLVSLWKSSELESPTDDGWHFVRCPSCEGSGLRSKMGQAQNGNRQESEMGQEASATTATGGHSHPHGADGKHSHPGLPEAGQHAHADDMGSHRHRPGDPLEGGHVNAGNGSHDHLLAKGLGDYVDWLVGAHWPGHAWLPGHVRTWIQHINVGQGFREATREDWKEHVLWNTHSSGEASPEKHGQVFLDGLATKFIRKEYEFEDGTRRPATMEDFKAEEKWLRENTPPELRIRLSEARVGEHNCVHLPNEIVIPIGGPLPHPSRKDLVVRSSEGLRISEFKVQGYDADEMTDEQLGDDFRLLAAKFATMLRKGKTEFRTVGNLEDFAVKVIGEILKRGKTTFRPKSQLNTTTEMLRRVLPRVVKRGLILVEPFGELIADGRKTLTVKSRPFKAMTEYHHLIQNNRSLGFVRHHPGREIDLKEFARLEKQHRISDTQRKKDWPNRKTLWALKVRDLILFEQPKRIRPMRGQHAFIERVKLLETLISEDTHTQSLSDMELVTLHGMLHSEWGTTGNPGKMGRDEILSAHRDVLGELRSRGLEHRPKDDLDRLCLGIEPGDILLKDVRKVLTHPISIKKPLIAIVGGVAVSGKGKDLDLWVNWPEADRDFIGALLFRIKSMLPREWNVHLVADTRGPFTNFIPLAELQVAFTPPSQRELVKMSEAIEPAAERQALETLKADRISPFRFYFMPKPQAGVRGDEPRTPENVLRHIPEKFTRFIVEPKFDGVRLQAHTQGTRTRLYTEGGKVVDPDLIPSAVAELSEMRKKGVESSVAETEAEIFVDGKKLGRSDVAGYLNSKTFDPVMDKGFRLTFHDLVYLNGKDIHKLDMEDSLKTLREAIPAGEHVRITPVRVVVKRKELPGYIRAFAARPFSEGAIVKLADQPYPLVDKPDKAGIWWTKFRKEGDLAVVILGREKVEKAQAWNYITGIKDAKTGKTIPLTKTFNSKLDLKNGSIARLSFGNINRHTDKKTGKVWYAPVFPRLLEPFDQDEPDTTAAADAELKKTGGEDFPPDMMPKELVRFSEATKGGFTQAEAGRKRKRRPTSYPTGFYRIFRHFRGSGEHADFRWKANSFLQGFTIADLPAGEIKKDVDTLADAYREQGRVPWKLSPDMDPTTKVVAIPKARQPLHWMNVFNVVFPPGRVGATREEEGVFSLADEGRLTLGTQKPVFKEFFMDGELFKGRMVFRLVSTRRFGKAKEAALIEGLETGMWVRYGTKTRAFLKESEEDTEDCVWRLVPWGEFEKLSEQEKPKTLFQWQVSTNLKDQTPTILGSRERRKEHDEQYVPKEGEKAIPPEWERLVKPEHRWWADGVRPKARLRRLDLAFNDLIERGELKARKIEIREEKESSFLLRRLFWKGPTVVRGLPKFIFSLIWVEDGKVREIKFEDDANPLQRFKRGEGIGARVEALRNRPPDGKSPKDWLDFPDDKPIPAAHPVNPNKKLPMFAERVDKGKLQILSERDIVITLQAKGKEMKGPFILRRSTPKDDIWTMNVDRVPGEKRRETVVKA